MSTAALTSRRYEVDPETGCWNWQGYLGEKGYGELRLNGTAYDAHRVSFLFHKGILSPFQQVHHLCNNKRCVNPDHLEAVTAAENVQAGALAKLTAEKVRFIRASGAPKHELAARFGVTHWTIDHIRKRKSWKNVA